MPSSKLVTLLSLALAPLVLAHFVVNTPPPFNTNIDNEDTAPCGGATPSSSDNGTDFHVDGDAIGITTLHAQSFLAYRGILGTDASSPNWTVLIPTIEEFGLNGFCEPSIAVPATWAGSSGLLQIIQDASDGVHYQCMPVNFVAGQGTPPSSCTNSSGVSAQFASDNTLSGIESSGGSSASPLPTGSSTQGSTPSPTTSSQPSSSPSKGAAASITGLETISGTLLAGVLCTLFNL